MGEIVISGGSGFSLRFFCLHKESVQIVMSSDTYQVTRRLYLHPNFDDLDRFFLQLSEMESPWEGERFWETIEGEFKIIATCDSLGHVTFAIKILNYQDSWCMEAKFGYDLGMLKDLSADFQKFWGQK